MNRIENIGGIERIEISAPGAARIPPVVIDKDVKEYIREIRSEPFLGELQKIHGTVSKLYLNKNVVEIRTSSGNVVKVFLGREDFERIRYRAKRQSVVTALGRPIFKLGMETKNFSEFEATEITIDV